MSKLLIDETPLLIIPSLANKIGLNESVVIQQFNYWLQRTEHIYDERPWVYKTLDELADVFTFWCAKTIQRTITSLKDDGYLITANFNKKRYDKTVWYTIDYAKIEKLEKSCDLSQRTNCPEIKTNCPKIEDKLSIPIPIDLKEKDLKKDLSPDGLGVQRQEEAVPYQDIMEKFKSICVELPKPLKITSERRKHINGRWKDTGGSLEFWDEYFTRIHDSIFLNNRDHKNRNNWSADFDWVINEQNMTKILEGKYNNKSNMPPISREDEIIQNLIRQSEELQ